MRFEASSKVFAYLIVVLVFFIGLSTSCEDAPSKNLVRNSGFEAVNGHSKQSYSPWIVESDQTCSGGMSGLGTQKCPFVAEVVSPGDDSKYAISMTLRYSVKSNGTCNGAVTVYQAIKDICQGKPYTISYRYRIPPVKGKHGPLTLYTGAGSYTNQEKVVPSTTWKTFKKTTFQPDADSQVAIFLGQVSTCKIYNPHVTFEVDDVEIFAK